MKFFLYKTDNKITSDKSLEKVVEDLQSGKYSVEFKLIRNQRTLTQNAYLHWVSFPWIAEYMWEIFEGMPEYSIKEGLASAKEAVIQTYLPRIEKANKLDPSNPIVIQTRTSDLDTKQCADLITTLCKDFDIPPPDDGRIKSIMDEYEKRYGAYIQN